MLSTKRTIFLTALLLLATAVASQAVMPPAPTEWYQKQGLATPVGWSGRVPAQAYKIRDDLARINAEREPYHKGRVDVDDILVILVEFPDYAADQTAHPTSAYDDLMFSGGVIPTGSLWEYYQEISYGQFSPQGVVVGWVMAPHDYTYYSDGQYGMGFYPTNSQGLLEDCINLLDPTVDFSQYDNNGDGQFQGVFLVHAGPGGEETQNGDDIWSHAWYGEFETDDGVFSGRYSIEPEELLGGEMIKIGVFCHEYGHVLGLPDLYDYDGSSEGVGNYCLMSGGSWGGRHGTPQRPVHMCSQMKYVLGWIEPEVISANQISRLLQPYETNPQTLRVNHPTNPNEYFLIDNRATIGFDSLLRGDGGLAIWHVDANGNQDNEAHPYVRLEQADGSFDLMRDYGGSNRHPRTNRGDAGDLYPGATGNDRFSLGSTPSNWSHDQVTEYLTVDNVQQVGHSVWADIIVSHDAPLYTIQFQRIVDSGLAGTPTDYDGFADSGEVVDLEIGLLCEGEGAASLKGTLWTADTRVTVLNSIGAFFPVTHGAATSNADSLFRFAVNSYAADSAVRFSLVLDADGDNEILEFRVNLNRPQVLLVLDDRNSHWSDRLVETMYSSGYEFDTYRTSEWGTPEMGDLSPYPIVMWTAGSYYGNRLSGTDYEDCLNAGEIALLTQFVNAGGRLGLFAQDYVYDVGFDTFLQNQMHMASVPTQDSACTGTIGAGPLAGFTGASLESYYYDFTDRMLPGSFAGTLITDGDGGSVMIYSPDATPSAYYAVTTYSGYGLERFDDASLLDFLQRWLSWMTIDLPPEVPLPIFPDHGKHVAGTDIELHWTGSNGGWGYFIQVDTSTSFLAPVHYGHEYPPASGHTVESLPEGSYYWRVCVDGGSEPYLQGLWSPLATFVVEPPAYVCGDVDNSGAGPDITDLVYLVNYMFKQGPPPPEMNAANVDSTGDVDIADLVYLVNFMFKQGPDPDCP